MKLLALVLSFFLLVGCATTYQKGYSETQVAENMFKVKWSGNWQISLTQAIDYALLRSAELTLNHDFKYFVMINESSNANNETVTLYLDVNNPGGQQFNISKPSASNTIMCFKEKPEQFSYDAQFIYQSIRAKYGIKDKSTTYHNYAAKALDYELERKLALVRNANRKASESPIKTYREGSESSIKTYSTTYELASKGNVRHQNNLGDIYHYGKGVNQDYKKAVKWYEKAAEQGHAEAQVNLGAMYYDGLGVTQDYKQAAKWYSKAAEQGDKKGQNMLGNMYYDGLGVTQDYALAYMWYSIAATFGMEAAIDRRDKTANEIGSSQLKKAQNMAKEWIANYKITNYN